VSPPATTVIAPPLPLSFHEQLPCYRAVVLVMKQWQFQPKEDQKFHHCCSSGNRMPAAVAPGERIGIFVNVLNGEAWREEMQLA